MPLLTPHRTVIAPDLRGGAVDVLDHFAGRADVAAIDAGVPIAFLLAAKHPERVRRLTLMEGTLPGLPGGFSQPPWWFGFHAIPGLAETVLEGHEGEYLDFFLKGVPRDIRDAFVRAHTGREALRESFAFYRDDGAAIRAAGRLTVPTLALGGSVVGDRLHQQLKPVADDLTGEIIEGSGHLIPLDRPDAVAERLLRR